MLARQLCWDSGDTGVLGNPLKSINYDSSPESSEENSWLNPHIPLLKTTKHLRVPFSPIKGNNGVAKDSLFWEIDSAGKTDDSEDPFSDVPKKSQFFGLSNKEIIDKVFEKFDDPYAKLPFPEIPRYTQNDDSLLLPRTPVAERYVPYEVQVASEKALAEGQRDFCRVLLKNGIDPVIHFSTVFSSKKKSTSKGNFECSTPKNVSSLSAFKTPLDNCNSIDSPLSGIKQLDDGDLSDFLPFRTISPFQSGNCDTSLNETISPVNLSPDVKATLLSGIVCYVDVRSGKESQRDRQEAINTVTSELLSLGARVEKNFTKKVTHVVFKEGRISTYLKAKKEGIPMVGILWIRACKIARGIADPALHPPKRMEKYENLMPDQIIKKRRLAILNPNSRVRKNLMLICGSSPSSPSPEKTRSRRAFTEMKNGKKKVSEKGSVGGVCGKKLLFDNGEENENVIEDDNSLKTNAPKLVITDSSSTDNSTEIRLAAARRRKSAPGKLLSKRNARREDIKAYFKKIEANKENIPTVNEECDKKLDSEALEPCKKKKKLFDPQEVFLSSQISENGSAMEDEDGSIKCQYKNISPVKKRARTRATNPTKTLKISIARKLNRNKKIDVFLDEEASSPSGNLFVVKSPGSISKKKQSPPAITFTSVPKHELPKYVEMVKKLGKYRIEEKVTKWTTHVVSNGPRRTINVIKGIARGCWLVDLKWVNESYDAGKWLPEDKFDFSSTFPAASECCKERRGLKSSRVVDIFKDAGPIFVSRSAQPCYKDLEEILRICSANITSSAELADIKVGGRTTKSKTTTVVSTKWVLDSVTENCLLPIDDYIVEVSTQCSQND